MRQFAFIVCAVAGLPAAGCCATLILPHLEAVACGHSQNPETWHPDRYTPVGFENVGGIFGMRGLLSVDPLACDYNRSRRFGDEFPYYEPPAPDVPPGFYVWLYLPDLHRGGAVWRESADRRPVEFAMAGFPTGDAGEEPVLCDSLALIALTTPRGAPPVPIPPGFFQGRTMWYSAGSTAALAVAGLCVLQADRSDADLGFAAAAERLARQLGGALSRQAVPDSPFSGRGTGD